MNISKEDFMERYGDVRVRFNSYFKYIFSFVGESYDGLEIYIEVGGDATEIYRFPVRAGDEELVSDLNPEAGVAYKEGQRIASFYDYINT